MVTRRGFCRLLYNIQSTSFCTPVLSYEKKTFREKKCSIYLLVYHLQLYVFYRSIYHLTMLAVPHLTKTQGSIVNVSSVNGIRSVSWYFLWLIHAHYYQWLWNTGDSGLLELWSIEVTCIDLSKYICGPVSFLYITKQIYSWTISQTHNLSSQSLELSFRSSYTHFIVFYCQSHEVLIFLLKLASISRTLDCSYMLTNQEYDYYSLGLPVRGTGWS